LTFQDKNEFIFMGTPMPMAKPGAGDKTLIVDTELREPRNITQAPTPTR
jgi:hypothetical protein